MQGRSAGHVRCIYQQQREGAMQGRSTGHVRFTLKQQRIIMRCRGDVLGICAAHSSSKV